MTLRELSLFSFCLLMNWASPVAIADEAEGQRALPPQKRILECIRRVTGLDAISRIEKTEFAPLSEASIPFLSSLIKDQVGIRVRLAPVKMNWPSKAGPVADLYLRYFTIYLDSDAKRILAVTSRLAERSPDIREPTADDAEGQIRGNSEVYSSFPSTVPKFTFMRTLEVHSESFQFTQEIDGVYVMYSRMGEKPHPVWVITTRGGPPNAFSFHHPVLPEGMITTEAPIWRRNSMRHVSDAIAGTWLLSSNTPQPP